MSSHSTAASKRTELEAAFIAALGPLRQKLRRSFDHELLAFGLSRALASPLVVISQNDGIHQREVADQLEIEGPSLVRLLDQLCANGLVVRRSDPGDQRAKTLHLTPAGKALTRRIMPVVERVRAQLLTGASAEELETCLRVFNRFLAACERGSEGTAK